MPPRKQDPFVTAHEHPIASHAWARVRLTRGRSIGQVWEVDSFYPVARLTVGSDPSAGWPIEAPGVTAVHLELFWNGHALWVTDPLQLGGVFLDRVRVTGWVQIQGHAELRFGDAALSIQTSASPTRPMSFDPRHARPVTLTAYGPPAGDEPLTTIFAGAASNEAPFASPSTQHSPRETGILERMVAALKPESSASKVQGRQALPTRTWILLGLTVMVTVGWLLWEDPQPQGSTSVREIAADTTAAPTGQGEPLLPGLAQAEDANANDMEDGISEARTGVESPTQELRGEEVGAPAPSASRSAERRRSEEGSEEDDEDDGRSLARRAADAYVEQRYLHALDLYRELAARVPDEPSYPTMVRILEERGADRR